MLHELCLHLGVAVPANARVVGVLDYCNAHSNLVRNCITPLISQRVTTKSASLGQAKCLLQSGQLNVMPEFTANCLPNSPGLIKLCPGEEGSIPGNCQIIAHEATVEYQPGRIVVIRCPLRQPEEFRIYQALMLVENNDLDMHMPMPTFLALYGEYCT